jgi:Cu(I)/Ag(I) efflux system membrane fusion protein
MTRQWIPAFAVLAVLGASACRKPETAQRSTTKTQPIAPSGGTGDMSSMPGMRGMPRMAGGADSAGVPLDRTRAAGLGISFARAAERPLERHVRLTGTLAYAEPRREYVNARVNGWVEGLRADYVGRPVRQGEVLLSIYAPDLLSAQEEYLSAKRLGDSSLMAAARRRLVLWNIPEDQIAMLDRTGQAQRTLVLRAPRSGEIAEKMVTNGQAVRAGDNLFLIADRRKLWVDLAVFEMDARYVRVGTPVTLTVDVLAGRTYRGRVTFIYPTVDEKTRTLTARAEVENDDGALRPGMYAMAEIAPSGRKTLTVPTGAVLPTGTENLVFVNRGDGAFVPRAVTVGARTDSLVEIANGLKPGDEVVASATYLLDSESNLASAMQGLMLQMGMGLNMGGMQTGGEQGGESMPGMKMNDEGMKDRPTAGQHGSDTARTGRPRP